MHSSEAKRQSGSNERRREPRRPRRHRLFQRESVTSSPPRPLLRLRTLPPTTKKMSSCPLASPDRPAIEAVLFDLDDTLYRIEAIPERVRENIEGESFFCRSFSLADLFFFSSSLLPSSSLSPPLFSFVVLPLCAGGFSAFMIDRLKIDPEVVPELVSEPVFSF